MQLDRLYDINGLPDGVEPLFDTYRISTCVYGVSVLTLKDARIRIDVEELGHLWRIVEVELPRCTGYRRSWQYEKLECSVHKVVEIARRWGGDQTSEPSGWVKSWDGRRRGEYEADAPVPLWPERPPLTDDMLTLLLFLRDLELSPAGQEQEHGDDQSL